MRINRFGVSQSIFVAMVLEFVFTELSRHGPLSFSEPSEQYLLDSIRAMDYLKDIMSKTFLESDQKVRTLNAEIARVRAWATDLLTRERSVPA